ncbi:BspA family leucine-rich repeat surface protein [Mycoplasma mycoides]|uniref:BspA family leucine-rich repeat surface protein n=1 Tax=Mycoplasma mycoides TaxID=2102 RepID=UPI00223EB86E|nr:BspA family leucine-rich repeat surface protein [Mycoplasma mycoides]QVK02437.1 DUF285 domain-containing protein [Mycoplasma mycoides subsp. capri]QVK03252.1 DUF285 domain-containing protein [Mycoplasma mycoides subsp. capri]
MKKLLTILGLTSLSVLPTFSVLSCKPYHWFRSSKIFKEPIYNAEKTECIQIGYFLEINTNKVQIEQFLPTTKKVPKDLPKEITSLSFAFQGNKNEFIEGIQYWDTSNVTNMACMFDGAEKFNQDISKWNTSNVEDMRFMFSNTTSFNQPIDNWDTSNVTDMCGMFAWTTSFNQDISKWDTSNVADMEYMFKDAKNFNQDLSNWNVSQVEDFKQFAINSNPNWKPKHKPKFNKALKFKKKKWSHTFW